MQFVNPTAPAAGPAAQAQPCPEWLVNAVTPEVRASPDEMQAVITALQRFFIGEPNDGGMFHAELYQAGDLFETQARAVEKIMVAIGAGNILAAGKDPVFSPTGVTDAETNGLSAADKAELLLGKFVKARVTVYNG